MKIFSLAKPLAHAQRGFFVFIEKKLLRGKALALAEDNVDAFTS